MTSILCGCFLRCAISLVLNHNMTLICVFSNRLYYIMQIILYYANYASPCVWAAVQTKASGDHRSSGRFGERRMLQSQIRWLTDNSSAPQMHLGASNMRQRYRHVPKRLTSVGSLFSATERLWGSSEQGGR